MEAETTSPWRFAQCFGDKGEVEDITEGEWAFTNCAGCVGPRASFVTCSRAK